MPVNRKPRLSRKKDTFREIVGITVEEFIETQCIGMGRIEISKKIEKVTNGEVKMNSPSTVWYWVRDGIKNGLIVNFRFSSRKPKGERDTDTPAPKQKQQIKKKVKIEEINASTEKTLAPPKPKQVKVIETPVVETAVPKIKEIDGIGLNIRYICQECGHESTEKTTCKSTKIIGLRAYPCPKCNKFETCIAVFKHKKIKCRKALIDKGYQKECFVDNDLEPIEDPFEECLTSTT